MKLSILSRPVLGALLAAAAFGAASATVQVEFTDPAKMTDAGRSYIDERDATIEGLRRHLVLRAGRLLPEGEKLVVTITDIDLAGGFEASQRYSREVRIVRRTYPPRIDLAFKLTRGDTVLREGSRSLTDTTFNEALRYRDDALGYEKQMLDNWLRREFGPEAK
jgi:hypothetical protein